MYVGILEGGIRFNSYEIRNAYDASAYVYFCVLELLRLLLGLIFSEIDLMWLHGASHGSGKSLHIIRRQVIVLDLLTQPD
jgi:hypothetical protein